jgi:hypothetical protein
MAGLDPAIHEKIHEKNEIVDPRAKPGDDGLRMRIQSGRTSL